MTEKERLIFYSPKILFFKHQCYPLLNSSLGQLHTYGDVVPTFLSNAGILQPIWFSVCPLHSFGLFFYKDLIERLRKRVIGVKPDIEDILMLHHENAPCRIEISVTEFFTSKGAPVIPQPPIY